MIYRITTWPQPPTPPPSNTIPHPNPTPQLSPSRSALVSCVKGEVTLSCCVSVGLKFLFSVSQVIVLTVIELWCIESTYHLKSIIAISIKSTGKWWDFLDGK